MLVADFLKAWDGYIVIRDKDGRIFCNTLFDPDFAPDLVMRNITRIDFGIGDFDDVATITVV